MSEILNCLFAAAEDACFDGVYSETDEQKCNI